MRPLTRVSPTTALLSLPLALALAAAAGCSSPGQDGTSGTDPGTEGEEDRPYVAASSPVEAGAYLVEVAGCNDCHTPGYLEAAGDVPRDRWLTGLSIGFRGPWGTTYPDNLRRTVDRMTEDRWVDTLRERSQKPPMPWFNLHAMSERDLRAIYRFIQSLGEAGEAVPANLPPGREPGTPYYPFVPQPPVDTADPTG